MECSLCNYLFAFLLLRWFHPDSWFTKKDIHILMPPRFFFYQQFRPLLRNLALYIQLLYLHIFMNLSKYIKHSLFCIHQMCWLCLFNSMKKVSCRCPGWNPQLPHAPWSLLAFSSLVIWQKTLSFYIPNTILPPPPLFLPTFPLLQSTLIHSCQRIRAPMGSQQCLGP